MRRALSFSTQSSSRCSGLGLIEILATLLVTMAVVVGISVSMKASSSSRASLKSESDFQGLLSQIRVHLEKDSSCKTLIQGSITDPNAAKIIDPKTFSVVGPNLTPVTIRNGMPYRNLRIDSVAVTFLSNAQAPKVVDATAPVASYLIALTIQATAQNEVVGPRTYSNATNPIILTVDVNAAGTITHCFSVQKPGGPAGGWRI